MLDEESLHYNLTVRVPHSWQGWVIDLREEDRCSTNSQLIERALRAYADQKGFRQPPSSRLDYKKDPK